MKWIIATLLLLVFPLRIYGANSFNSVNAIQKVTFQKIPQSETTPLNGLSYQKYRSSLNQIIHVLEIDPKQFSIKVVHANNQVQGIATVEKMAIQNQAIAAINGGFFHGEPREGFPAGILKIANDWYGIAYSSRGAIGFGSPKISALIDRVQTKTVLLLNNHKFPVHALNQLPDAGRAILYTQAYGKESPPLLNGFAIVIENNVIKTISAAESHPIPKEGFVYVLGARLKIPNVPINIGMKTKVSIEILPQFIKEAAALWQEMNHIVGGAPVLISHKRRLHDFVVERVNQKFVHKPHARTAVGLTQQGHWLFVVVEKSSFTNSPGMSLIELGLFMQQLGAEHALNLDGGGSSTFYYRKKVLNHPEVEIEEGLKIPNQREVSDAILVVPKESMDKV